jgi:hypothetical protein
MELYGFKTQCSAKNWNPGFYLRGGAWNLPGLDTGSFAEWNGECKEFKSIILEWRE